MSNAPTLAVISGGASGLGLATAERLVADGGRAVLLDIDDAKGQAAVAELGEDSARYLNCNVCDEAAMDIAIKQAADWLGGLNVAVACAGVLGAGRVLGKTGPMALDHFRRTIEINLVGTFNLARAAVNVMQHNAADADNHRGVVVMTASVAAFEGQIGQAAYSASKGGVAGMTLPMARELGRFGLRVVTIAPGIFATAMVDGMPETVQSSLEATIPYPSRLGRGHEFASLVAHILDNHYINGAVLRLDGAVRLTAK
jgi:NAD(P)-dependent dehydrogenase (short-subunit alcohol dehydrogenase family)